MYKYDLDRIVWYFCRLSSCCFLSCCSDFLPTYLRGNRGIVTVYRVIVMRTIGMGELEEIGRKGWLCDDWFYFRWFGSGLPGVDRFLCRFLCRLPRPADMLFLRLLLNIFSLFHTLRLRLPLHVSDSAHGWLISEIWHYLSPFYYIEPLQILQDCLHGFFSYVYKKECRKTDTLFQIHCLQYLNLEK